MAALQASRPTVSTAVAPGRGTSWPVAIAAGLFGAALANSLLAATGALGGSTAEPAVEKVALTPVVSSPMLPGDRGVPALAQRVRPSIVRIVVHGAQDGDVKAISGVVYRTDGLLLTSAHEVSEAQAITVVLHDGQRHAAELVGLDLPTDVAVIRVGAGGLPVAVLGSSAGLEVGTPTVAFGCPNGEGESPRLTTGVISGLDRRVVAHGAALHGMIQTDAPIEAAAAGGPLVDAHGAVIGITTRVAGEHGAAFGYATPIDLVARVAQELLRAGHAVHGWLGIEGADLPMAQAEEMGVPGGALVRQVEDASPAAVAGLLPGDVIVAVDGATVESSSDLVVVLRQHHPGDTVVVVYQRNGRRAETSATLGQRPPG
jgi:S1-C subfamily serine protease